MMMLTVRCLHLFRCCCRSRSRPALPRSRFVRQPSCPLTTRHEPPPDLAAVMILLLTPTSFFIFVVVVVVWTTRRMDVVRRAHFAGVRRSWSSQRRRRISRERARGGEDDEGHKKHGKEVSRRGRSRGGSEMRGENDELRRVSDSEACEYDVEQLEEERHHSPQDEVSAVQARAENDERVDRSLARAGGHPVEREPSQRRDDAQATDLLRNDQSQGRHPRRRGERRERCNDDRDEPHERRE